MAGLTVTLILVFGLLGILCGVLAVRKYRRGEIKLAKLIFLPRAFNLSCNWK